MTRRPMDVTEDNITKIVNRLSGLKGWDDFSVEAEESGAAKMMADAINQALKRPVIHAHIEEFATAKVHLDSEGVELVSDWVIEMNAFEVANASRWFRWKDLIDEFIRDELLDHPMQVEDATQKHRIALRKELMRLVNALDDAIKKRASS